MRKHTKFGRIVEVVNEHTFIVFDIQNTCKHIPIMKDVISILYIREKIPENGHYTYVDFTSATVISADLETIKVVLHNDTYRNIPGTEILLEFWYVFFYIFHQNISMTSFRSAPTSQSFNKKKRENITMIIAVLYFSLPFSFQFM